MKKKILLVIFLTILFSAPRIQAKEETGFDFIDVSRLVQLKNGMEVLMIPDKSVPLVASMVIVKVGSVREDDEMSGFSYLLSHLLFDGTESRTKEALDLEIKGMGAYVDTITTPDFTAYLMAAHNAYSNKVLKLQSDILFNSKIQKASVDREQWSMRRRIYEEKLNPDFALDTFFRRQLHERTPYERSIYGNGFKLSAEGLERLLGFYRNYYVPNNMCAIIRGNFELAEMKRLLDFYFGSQVPSNVPPSPEIEASACAAFEKSMFHKITGNNRRKILQVGYKGINVNSHDITALIVLKEALSEGGGLLEEYFEKQNIPIFSAYADLSYNQFYGTFKVRVDFHPDADENEILPAINALMSTIAHKGLDEERLSRVKKLLINKEKREAEKIHEFLLNKGYAMVALGLPYISQYPILVNKITSDEISITVQKYLDGKAYFALASLPYETTREERKARVKDRGRVYRQSKTLQNGLRIIADKKPDSEIFAVHILAGNQAAREPKGLEGISEFMHRMLVRGTKKQSKAKIQNTLRELGATLSVANDNEYIGNEFLSRDYSSICFETSVDMAEKGVDFLEDLLRNPSFSKQEIADLKEEMKYIISVKEQDQALRAESVLFREIMADQDMGKSPFGTLESIQRIDEEKLESFHETYFAPDNLIISVVSGLEPADVISMFEKKFMKMKGNSPSIALKQRVVSNSGKWVEKMLGYEQSYLNYCIPLPKLGQKDRLVMTLATALLRDRIRNTNTVAYDPDINVKFSPSVNLFQITLKTSPKRVKKVVSELKRQIKQLQTEPLLEENLIRCINQLTGELEIKTLASINQAAYLSLAQYIGDEHYYGQDYPQKLRAITPDQVKAGINHYLNTNADIVVVIR
ncbi:MAG: M16 family metallopeptidase [bacterium]